MVRAQAALTLFVLDVAELSVCTVLLRVGATAPIRLTHDNVAESALALLILVAMFVVARLVVLVCHQTRLLLRRAEPVLAIVGGTLSVCLAVLTIRTVLFGVLLTTRVALPRHLATIGIVLTVCVSVTGFVGGSQFLPAVEFGARRDFGFALVIGTESTLALVVLLIAKLSILAILLRILFATHIWLSHDDVTESTLAPIVLVAIHLFVVALGFVLCQTRVALLFTEGLLVAVALSVVALDFLLRRLCRVTVAVLCDLALGTLSPVFGTGEALPSRGDSNTFSELLLGPTLSPLAVLGHLTLWIAHEPEKVVRALIDAASDGGSEDELRDLLTAVHEAVRLSALVIVLVLQTHTRAVFRRVHTPESSKLSLSLIHI